MSRSVNKTASSEGVLLRSSHLVPLVLGFVLIFSPGLIRLSRHDMGGGVFIEVLGASITIVGLLFAVWGRLHLGKYWSGIITLKEGHKLIRTGPYRMVRHPLYMGFLLGALGSAITAHSIDAFVGFGIMLVAYLAKIRREEALLTQQFGDEYATFKREVKTLIPYVF